MTALAATIVHPSTADALAAYLAGRTLPYTRVMEYMARMHSTSIAETQAALWGLVCEGRVVAVEPGVWRGRGGYTSIDSEH